MELRHLRYCIAVAEEGSFTRAAKRLGLAQQAVSRQIADLERELGIKLFERNARGAVLTPAGGAFVEGARGALGETLRAVQRARAQSETGLLRLAYSYLTPPHFALLGEALARFHHSLPNMSVTVQHLSTGAQTQALQEGEIDVAFGYLPEQETGGIVSDLLRDDPIVGVLLPAAHPLASQEMLWLRDLASLPLLVMARDINPVTYDSVLAGLAARGLTAEPANIQAIGAPAVSLVAQGCCWKLMSPSMVEEAHSEPAVVFRRFLDPPLPFGLWLRHPRVNASALGQQFVSLCMEKQAVGHSYSLVGLCSLWAFPQVWLSLQSQVLLS